MSFLSSTSVRMRYALQDQSIVPEWKLLYYDSQTLSMLIELMQKISFLQNKIRKYIMSPYKKQNQFFLMLYKCLHNQMRELDIKFVKYHFCQNEVIFIFVQMKYRELSQKFKKYKTICSTSNHELADQISRCFKIQFKKDNMKSIIQALLAISNPQQQQLSENVLIIWENLYIQCLLLKKLIMYNQKQEQKVLQMHAFVVDKYFQFDRPQQLFPKQKYKKLCNNLQKQIQSYINHKKIYVVDDAKHQNKFKQLVNFIQNSKQKEHINEHINIGFWFFGLWSGLILFSIGFLLCLLYINNISLQNSNQFESHFPIWRGLSEFIIFVWTLGMTLGVLQIKQINYKLIFSLDQSFVPTSFYTLIVAAAFSTIYMIFFVGYVITINYTQLEYLPGIFWLFTLFVLFNPLPILNWRSRLYWSKMLLLMIISPFNFKSKVDFKINWLTEQFVSFKQPFHDMVYTINFYLIDRNSSYKTSIIIGQIITMGVLFWRILQGLKTGFDNGVYLAGQNVLLKGAIKCSLGILTILFSLLYRIQKSNHYLTIWIIVAIFATLYTYYFDIKYDWGLLDQNSENSLLTNLLTFKPRVYYFVMILNFILRLAWTLNISTGIIQSFNIQPYIFIMIIAYLQIIRRSIWNILKIQRQHLRGCEKYQAIVNYKDIQQNVQKLIFKESIQKYVNKIQKIFSPLKTQEIIQSNKQFISEIDGKYFLESCDEVQMKQRILKNLLNIENQLIQERKRQEIELLNQKVEETQINKKNYREFIKIENSSIQVLEKIVLKAEAQR